MKQRSFMLFFFTVQLIGICLYIYKYNLLLQNSYRKQNVEKKHQALITKEQQLQQELCNLQDCQRIKEYAQQELAMIPLTLTAIHRLPVSDGTNEHI